MKLCAICALVCGCTMSSQNWMSPDQIKTRLDESEYSARQLQIQGKDALGESLASAYEVYMKLKADGPDSSWMDSVVELRQPFFEKWRLSSDSLCDAIDYDKYLRRDFRIIYEAVLETTLKKYPEESNTRYIVLPKEINYKEVEAESFEEIHKEARNSKAYPKKTIEELCVDYRMAGHDRLLLSDLYLDALDAFMGFGKTQYLSAEEEKTRMDFLSSAITVTPRLSDGGFHYMTIPSVEYVYFDMADTLAVVKVRESSEGGKFYHMKKSDDNWIVVEKAESWRN